MAGFTATPADVSLSKIASGIRAMGNMGKLGAAVFSAIPSGAVTGAANLRFNGKPLFQVYSELLREFLKGRGSGEARQISWLVGEGFDGLIQHIISPYCRQRRRARHAQPGDAHLLSLERAHLGTDAMRAAGARILSAWLGEHAGQAWDALPDALTRASFFLVAEGIELALLSS